MFKLNRILLAGAMLALASTTSMAATLPPGGLGGTALGITLDPAAGGDLLLATTFTGDYLLGAGTGSLAAVAGVDSGVTLDLSSIGTFTLSTGGFTFFSGVLSDSSSNVSPDGTKARSFTLNGLVTLGPDSNTSTVIIGFVQAVNGPITSNLSLVVPATIPEPASVALAGIGLAAAGLFGLRKRVAK